MRIALALLAAAGAIAALWAMVSGVPRPAGAGASTIREARGVAPVATFPDLGRAKAAIEPALLAAEARNHAVAERAVARVHARFTAFRAGAKPFAEDMASWSTRIGVLRRLPGDWWDRSLGEAPDAGVGMLPGQADAVGEFVRAKFQKHVVAPGAAEQAIADALAGAAEDLAASRNLLWADIGAALHGLREVSVHDSINGPALEATFTAEAARLAERHAGATLGAGLSALAVSAGGSFAVEQAAAAILSRVGAGATGGAFAGPAGVVVGVGLGIVVGFAIDWWMTEEYVANLRAQVEARVDELERAVIEGDPAARSADAPIGVREAVRAAARTCDEAQRAAAMRAIEGVEP